MSRRLSSLAILLLGAAFVQCAGAQSRDPFEEARRRMVDEDIAGEGIRNERVLESLRNTPRHLFVRPELRRYAYFDQAVDIGYRQTISPPFIVAYMTETLDPQPEDRVLEIGTGSGYQAAVLSPLVKDVYTIEIIEPLGRDTTRLLKRLDYDNVHTKIGDGYLGWPEEAPFDKIIVTCSPESIPQPLVDQLKDGGRMIIPVGERYQQVFHLLEKKDGRLVESKLLPTLFVPMTGRSEELREVQPDPANPRIVNGGFEQTTLEEGKADGWHYQRRSQLLEEGAAEGNRAIRFDNEELGRSAHILQGLAIDGDKVGVISLSLQMKLENVRPGPVEYERPGLMIHFFDSRRIPMDVQQLGPWMEESTEWKTITGRIVVPRGAKEAILRVGLNGAAGTLWLDDLRLIPQPR
jgi:protein-L-isoaspartate(D-aspartate) O-methyltransferase